MDALQLPHTYRMMDSDTESSDKSIWDFRAARRFARAFGSGSEESATAPDIPDPALYNPKSSIPKSLGDFDRLFEFCGKPIDIPPPDVRRLSSGSSSSSSSQSLPSTPPTSAPDDNDLEDGEDVGLKIKEVRWKDQIIRASVSLEPPDAAEKPGATASATSQEALDVSKPLADTDDDDIFSGYSLNKSKLSIPASLQPSSLSPSRRPVVDTSLVKLFDPKSYPPPPIPKTYVDPFLIQPIHTLTADEQKAKLVKKLVKRFPREFGIRAALSLLGTTHVEGIHVFVDLSNITIGFMNRLKYKRDIPERTRVRQPAFSFQSLAVILERGRDVARRVVVGSTITNLYQQSTRLPSHVEEAASCNYELSILERVSKPQSSTTPKKKKRGAGCGYVTSGYSSTSESTAIRLAMQEQAVDEILQMKILESLVDNEEPSTIVLASGDAAEAEYSGGFLTNVERALRKGWKVEVVAWSQGLSHEYRRKEFLKRWENNFKYINLDDYCEEMLALYTPKFKYVGD